MHFLSSIWRRLAAFTVLFAGLSGIAVFGWNASSAFAAAPTITVSCPSGGNCNVQGSGFTPGGQVLVQSSAGSTVVSSYYVVASDSTEICSLLKPVCHVIGGGNFTTVLPADSSLPCGATAAGTVRVTDTSSGFSVTNPVTLIAACSIPTTTSLSLPSTVDTGWAGSINPARVSAGSTAVTSGTVTITVNGTTFCTYNAGAASGCTVANLPVGTDTVQAFYSGSAVPWYAPSSTTATVAVLAVSPSVASSSANWAGFVDSSDTYSAVSGSWTVPMASCGSFPFGDAASSSATWVGIDGNTNNTVEQIGTDSNCVAWTGEYHAWWEMAPGAPVVIDIFSHPVHPGDSMTASVVSTGSPGTFTLALSDATQHWTYSTTQSLASAVGGSAEWITEQPSAGGIPLTNFGSVTFTQARATGSNGLSTPIWDHANLAVSMVGATTKAAPSSLSSDGSQFSISWLHG